MSYLLHIETATNICSVAISENDKLKAISEEADMMRHSEIITLLIDKVFKKADITVEDLAAVSLSEGPGSYTSLRVGMSAAKAICFAMDIPLISVNTLHSLYLASKRETTSALYCPMIDARRMEVYASLYGANEGIFDNTPIILEEDTFEQYLSGYEKIVFSGNGSDKAKKLYQTSKYVFSEIKCSAENLIKPAYEKFQNKEFVDLAYFSPNYIKPPNITTPKPIKL